MQGLIPENHGYFNVLKYDSDKTRDFLGFQGFQRLFGFLEYLGILKF